MMTQVRNDGRRLVVFLGLSVVAHLVGVGGLAALHHQLVPHLDVTWLDLDNVLGSPPVGPPDRELTAPAEPPPPVRVKPKPPRPPATPAEPETVASVTVPRHPVRSSSQPDAGAPRDAGPRPAPTDAGARDGASGGARFTAAQSVLSELAPGDASLMLLLRMDRVRGSPYEGAVRRLLEVFYDHKTILWSSGIDPLRDFAALLIATPNPYRVTQTFLAAQYSGPSTRIRRALERATRYKDKRLRWTRSGGYLRGEIPSPPKLPGDPRIVILRPGLVMLSDPKNVSLLGAVSPGAHEAPVRPSGSPGPTDAGVPGLTWMERLSLMRAKGGSGDPGPGLMLQAINLQRLVALPGDMPVPSSLQVTVSTTDPAAAEAVLVFPSPQVARAFQTALPQRLARLRQSFLLRLLGVTDLVSSIRWQRKESTVWASLKLTGDQVRALLEVIRGMIPQVRVPGMPERRPPDAGAPPAPAAATPDAGRRTDAGPPRDRGVH